MFGIGGFNPVSLLATAAMGPMGGIIAQLATQVVSQIGQQFIQQLGQQMGLPQSAIEMAQGAFSSSFGDVQGTARNLDEAIEALGNEAGDTAAQIGQAQRDTFDQILDLARESAESEDARSARAGGKAPGWLMAMARSLGSTLNKLGDEMEQVSNQIKDGKASLSTEFTVLGQQFSMVSNASGTTLKAVGEGMANMARKG
ncbi:MULTISPECIES: hypothetical protein [unclassified Sphingomonas]|jgi:hypothetical protein|uniref:hypothetical protein n=1 Tax=unclassified Sphingomonas TaxID=196159 RepID=UPI00082EB7F4|nr:MULTISPECIES: hypothetical protein [unclassified Sphingomonas]MCH4891542.1 hypothetical protein [Sphingomonas sp. SFZ2018-12]